MLGWCSDRFGLRRLPIIISTVIVLVLMVVVVYGPILSLPMIFVLFFTLGFFSSAYALPFSVMRDIMPANVVTMPPAVTLRMVSFPLSPT